VETLSNSAVRVTLEAPTDTRRLKNRTERLRKRLTSREKLARTKLEQVRDRNLRRRL
jgi:hypothetical protein